MVAHAFNSGTQEAKTGLDYRASSRTGAKATQRNPDSKNYKNKKQIEAQGIQFVGPRPYLEGDVLGAPATKGHGVL